MNSLPLIEKGFYVVPIPPGRKGPISQSWPALEITAETVADHFKSADNVGIILGHNGLVDVDLDCDEAIKIAHLFLPTTRCVFGRKSARAAHMLYYCDPAPVVQTYDDRRRGAEDKKRIIELRCLKKDGTIGLQTMAPGSTHPMGELVEWEPGYDQTPTSVDPEVLQSAVARIAASVLLARYAPGEHSGRNEYYLAVDGMLLRAGWDQEDAYTVRKAIWTIIYGKALDETSCRAEFLHSVSMLDSGAPLTGRTRLKQSIDPQVIATVFKWLALKSHAEIEQEKRLTDARMNLSVPTTMDAGWLQKTSKKKNGIEPAPTLGNAMLMLESSPDFHGSLAHNEFTDTVTWMRDVPLFGGVVIPQGETLRDQHALHIMNHAERTMDIIFSRESIDQGIMAAANKQSSHPVRNYLTSLPVSIIQFDLLDTWLIKFLHCDDTPYARAVGRKFLISAVARIMQPGCQVDHMLVLEGSEQGEGKTSAIKHLFGKDLVGGGLKDLNNKDELMKLRGKWCFEMGEMTHLSRNKVGEIKDFIVERTDRLRVPYGRSVQDFPRQNVFIGTTNDAQYLSDDKNRRYWPVRVNSRLSEADRADLEAARDQIWSEAYQAYLAGEKWWFTDDEADLEKAAQFEQEERRMEDPWQSPVDDFLEHCEGETTMAALFAHFGILAKDMKSGQAKQIAYCLKVAGWVRYRSSVSSGRKWVYRPKTKQLELGPRVNFI